MNNFILKIKKALIEKRFLSTVLKKLYPYFRGFFLLFLKKDKRCKLFVPKNNITRSQDPELIKRIFDFYKIMKKNQANQKDFYKPSSLWQNHIDKDFYLLKESFTENDINKFTDFIQNFGNRNYLGVESQDLIQKYSKNIFLKNFMESEMFGGHLRFWEYFNQNKEDISSLNFPRHGNQNGAYIKNNFVVIGSFFADIYAKIIKKYLSEINQNIIADLGSGYGYFDYYILKNLNEKTSLICFDIPETLTLSAYFLSKSFPQKKTFLYGENELSQKNIKNYNLIFMPCWEIEKMEENSIDMMVNKNSLGEIEPDCARNYLNLIYKTSKYFFSMNHEYFRNKFKDGKLSLINEEYNQNGKFKELIRYPDLDHLTYLNNKIDLDMDVFFYLYEKK